MLSIMAPDLKISANNPTLYPVLFVGLTSVSGNAFTVGGGFFSDNPTRPAVERWRRFQSFFVFRFNVLGVRTTTRDGRIPRKSAMVSRGHVGVGHDDSVRRVQHVSTAVYDDQCRSRKVAAPFRRLRYARPPLQLPTPRFTEPRRPRRPTLDFPATHVTITS